MLELEMGFIIQRMSWKSVANYNPVLVKLLGLYAIDEDNLLNMSCLTSYPYYPYYIVIAFGAFL